MIKEVGYLNAQCLSVSRLGLGMPVVKFQADFEARQTDLKALKDKVNLKVVGRGLRGWSLDGCASTPYSLDHPKNFYKR